MAANKLTVTDRATVVTLFSYIGCKTALATTMALTKRAGPSSVSMLRRGYAVHCAGLCVSVCVCVCTAGGRRQKIANDVIKHVISFD